MRCRFITVDVFTSRPLEGNPLAVFPDARGLPDDLMRRIARELNLSETVFVLPPDEPQHTRCLRIFTPKSELPFAGHPTVGTAVPVLIRSEEGRPVFTQLSVAKLPEEGPTPPDAAERAEMLSLAPDDLLTLGEDHPQGFSCGGPFLFIPLRNRDAHATDGAFQRVLREVLALAPPPPRTSSQMSIRRRARPASSSGSRWTKAGWRWLTPPAGRAPTRYRQFIGNPSV